MRDVLIYIGRVFVYIGHVVCWCVLLQCVLPCVYMQCVTMCVYIGYVLVMVVGNSCAVPSGSSLVCVTLTHCSTLQRTATLDCW